MNTRWYFQPIFDSYFVPLVVGAVLLVLLMVGPAFSSAQGRRRSILAWLRTGVIACVVLAMMRPTIVKTETKPLASTLAILVDSSRSMQTKDVDGSSRWTVATQMLDGARAEFATLQDAYKLRLFCFDDGATEISIAGDKIAFPAEPDGNQTDLGAALDDVLRLEAGQRLGGVMILSDGAQRSLAPRIDAGQAARQLARLNCPLYTVTLGQSRDRSQARDVAIENFEDHYQVFAKNQITFRSSIHIQGFVGQPIPVQLQVTHPDGTQETIGPTTLTATEDSESLDVRFDYEPNVPGQYQLLLVATPQPGERITDNNSLGAFLKVLEGGLKVLYLCGNIGWQEHNLIRRSIDKSLDIQLDFRWVDARRRSNWPIDLTSELSSTDYDVVILADVDATALGTAQIATLAELVGNGKGLLMTGGTHSFAAGGYASTKLQEAIPVEMSRFDRQSFDEPIREEIHWPGELQMLPTAAHFVTRMGAGPADQDVWRRLPPLKGANKLLQPSKTAIVLAQSERDQPLLVQGQFGLGRVLAFAGDSTFRWYRYGYQDAHKRFWRQVILWLAQKDDQQDNEVQIRLDQRRFTAGAQVPFVVSARDSLGEPIEDARIEVELIGPNSDGRQGNRIPVTREKDSWVGVTPEIEEPGDYELKAVAFRGQQQLGSADVQFIILDQDIELADPTANPAQMKMLAALTSDAGGKSLAVEQVPELLRELQEKPVESTTEFESRWQLTDTPADAWLMFLGIVGLLSTEWFLRKRWSMV